MKRAPNGRWLLPVLSILAVSAGACGPTKPSDRAARAAGVPVILTPVVSREFGETLTVYGDVRAKRSAVVSARIPGTIETIFVEEGDRVEVGTQLFQTDHVKCEKALEMARKSADMARLSLREARSGLEVAEADFEAAERIHGRYKKLLDDGGVMREAYDQTETAYRKARAGVEHARTVVEIAAEGERQSVLSVKIAEKDLEDTLVRAPIAGTVSERRREPGEMSSPGEPVIRIDDTSVVEVTVSIPARHYMSVVPGKTTIRIRSRGVGGGVHAVTYKSPTIDDRLRTFKARCLLSDPPEGLVPGAMVEAVVTFARRRGLAVPVECVLRREGRRVIFTVEGERALEVPVEVGLEEDGLVEIAGTTLSPGAPVLSMGQFLVHDGATVDVRKGAE